MFELAILIGIYSYVLFVLGLLGFFYKEVILLVSFLFVLAVFFLKRNRLVNLQIKDVFGRVLIALLFIQAFVNLIGALGPELGFDALWYHLTLPKIYLSEHAIVHIPGSLLYYSDMPKLTELIYAAGLAFGSEIFAKLIHFSFGILTLFALYKISRKFFSKTFSLLVLVLFYSNLVVGWMSITAYVDLARTFFEIMALWGFLEWQQKKESKWLIESAVMLGLAISTKLLALGSLFIFTILIIIFVRRIANMLIYLFFALLIPLPFFIFSYIHTGSPLYPFFSGLYPVRLSFSLINPLNLADPISSLYVILVPIGLLFFNKLELKLKIISSYSLLAFLVWQLTPNTGGGRFILPYLPAFSLLSIAVLQKIKKIRVRYVLIGLVIFFSVFAISYRFWANWRYVPVILGIHSKKDFLSKYLNFSFGDFYDTDSYFETHIKKGDRVLLYGFHNLYYVNFPFVDSTFVKEGDMFSHIATQNSRLPKRFSHWNLIYQNAKTGVKLYSIGGQKWVY